MTKTTLEFPTGTVLYTVMAIQSWDSLKVENLNLDLTREDKCIGFIAVFETEADAIEWRDRYSNSSAAIGRIST